MPLKWKLFRVANFLQLVITLILAGSITFTLISNGTPPDGLGWLLLVIVCLLILIVSNLFNLYLLQRHFPGISLSRGKERSATVLLILSILINIALIVIVVIGIISEVETDTSDNTGVIVIYILSGYILLGIYVMIMQATLPVFIERSNRRLMQELVDKIGEPSDSDKTIAL